MKLVLWQCVRCSRCLWADPWADPICEFCQAAKMRVVPRSIPSGATGPEFDVE